MEDCPSVFEAVFLLVEVERKLNVTEWHPPYEEFESIGEAGILL